MKRYLLLALVTASTSTLFAQAELSAFTSTGRAGVATTFVTDYQCAGINPANLGWQPKYEGKKFTTSAMEFTFSLYSEPLKKQELRQIFKEILGGERAAKLTLDEKKQAAIDFTDAKTAMNLDLAMFSFAAQFPKAGGFSFTTRERIQWFSQLNKNASEILFLGYNASYFDIKLDSAGNNISDSSNAEEKIRRGVASNPKTYNEVFDGTHISLSWMREYNLSYGHHLINNEDFKLFAGAGIKYFQGIAIIDVQSNNGEFSAFTAFSPAFDLQFDSAAVADNPSALAPDTNSFLPKSVGSGFGFDLGVSVIIKDRIKLGLAVNDIGSVLWDGNVYTAPNDTVYDISSDGVESYNVMGEALNSFGESAFAWKGASSKRVALPTVLRTGASIAFGENKSVEVGIDAIIPFNNLSGNYEDALFAIGGDVWPTKWLRLSTGMTFGGNYDFNLPVGLGIVVPTGTWEFGIASRDAISFFADNGPTISLSTGFLRFRF